MKGIKTMKTTLTQLQQFNDKYEREEYLYTVELVSFKKYNDGTFHHMGGEDTCFCLTNDFEVAKAKYKEACDHAHLGREHYLVTLNESKIYDDELWHETIPGMKYTNIPDGINLMW